MRIVKLKGKKASLTNKGELSLLFVGVGSAFTKRQYQTNLLIIKGDTNLLVDCGTRCPHALYELGLSVTDIDNLVITHSHADHVGGLEEVALMNRYVAGKKTSIIITKEYQDMLWKNSLVGGCSFNERKDNKFLKFEDFWDVIRPEKLKDYPRETFEARIGSLDIKLFRTKHIPDNSTDWKDSVTSYGIIIDDKVMFTSDTRFDEELVLSFEKMFNLRSIFHDCQFFTGGVHASFEELNQLPADIKKKIYLVHYGDNWEKFEKTIENYGFMGLGKQSQYYIFN
ncbi:MAG: MBL fold metallo-hydrolase [Spirochaetes bacterium]|nr:MBL fold metallo-hydrolase [Spirochaetota bacterium]